MNFYALFAQLLALATALILAPLLNGWINQCRAWMQNRSAPPLLQTYYTLNKLFHKDAMLAHNASSLFRAAPYVNFSCMALASAIVPTLSTELIFHLPPMPLRSSDSSRWPVFLSRWPAWTSALRSARWDRGARC